MDILGSILLQQQPVTALRVKAYKSYAPNTAVATVDYPIPVSQPLNFTIPIPDPDETYIVRFYDFGNGAGDGLLLGDFYYDASMDRNSVDLQVATDNGNVTSNPIEADSFIKSGSTDQDVLMGDGSTKAYPDVTVFVLSEIGKGLSEEDFTTILKDKLDLIEDGAQKNVQSDWDETDSLLDSFILNKPVLPTKVSQLTNDLGYARKGENEQITGIWTFSSRIQFTGDISDYDGKVGTAGQVLKRQANATYLWKDETGGGGTGDGDMLASMYDPDAIQGNVFDFDNFFNVPGYAVIDDVNDSLTKTYSSTYILSLLSGKVDTEAGKGLSEENFTTILLGKLNGIEDLAEVNVQSDWNEAGTGLDSFILNKPTLGTAAAEDIGFFATFLQGATADTAVQPGNNISILNNDAGYTTESWVNSQGFITTDTQYTAGLRISISGLNVISAALQSTNDFSNSLLGKLNGIQTGANKNVQVDWNAISGDDFIKNKPSIPPGQIKSDWNATGGLAEILNKPNLGIYVEKVSGKGLSANDFTNGLLSKLNGIAAGAQVNVQSDWDETSALSDAYILNKPTFTASPWKGTYPEPYINYSNANVRIGSAATSSAKLHITSSGSRESIVIDDNAGHTRTIMSVNNTYGGGEFRLHGSPAGVDISMFNTLSVRTFQVQGNGNILTTGSITANGSTGNSSQVLFGGSSPSWGYIPSQTDYNFTAAFRNKLNGIATGAQVNVQSDWNATFGDSYIKNKPSISGNIYSLTKNGTKIDFKENGTLLSNIKFAGTGGLTVHGNTAATITFDGSANVNVQADWNATYGDAYIKNKPNIPVSAWTISGANVYRNSKVGINASLPTQDLDVNGNVRIRKLLYDYYNSAGSGLTTPMLSTGTSGIQWIEAPSGGSSPWTTSGSNIYRNSGVTIGGTTTADNEFRVYQLTNFYNEMVNVGDTKKYRKDYYYDTTNNRGYIDGLAGALNIVATQDIKLRANTGVVLIESQTEDIVLDAYGDINAKAPMLFYDGSTVKGKIEASLGFLITSPSGQNIGINAGISNSQVKITGSEINLNSSDIVKPIGGSFANNHTYATSSNYSLPSASGYTNGTEKAVINTSGSNITITFNGSNTTYLPSKGKVIFTAYSGSWYGGF